MSVWAGIPETPVNGDNGPLSTVHRSHESGTVAMSIRPRKKAFKKRKTRRCPKCGKLQDPQRKRCKVCGKAQIKVKV